MRKRYMLLFVLSLMILCSCGQNSKEDNETKNSDEAGDESANKDNYVFEYNGVTISMNEKASSILKQLGKEDDYFEAKSCAFEGIDKTYTYKDFILYTYPIDGVDYVNGISIKSDLVSTKEGISLNSGKDKVTQAYGTDCENENNGYTYTKGKSKLQFIVEEDKVTAIDYIAITK